MLSECCNKKLYLACGRELYDPDIEEQVNAMPANRTIYYVCMGCLKASKDKEE